MAPRSSSRLAADRWHNSSIRRINRLSSNGNNTMVGCRTSMGMTRVSSSSNWCRIWAIRCHTWATSSQMLVPFRWLLSIRCSNPSCSRTSSSSSSNISQMLMACSKTGSISRITRMVPFLRSPPPPSSHKCPKPRQRPCNKRNQTKLWSSNSNNLQEEIMKIN